MTADVLVLVNPVAGRGQSPAAAGAVVRGLAAAGLHADLCGPTDASGMASAAAEAADAGVRCVVACGGDGTVHWTLQGLVGSATALAVVPVGTGNDIATTLGQHRLVGPNAGATIAACLAAGQVRSVDVARAQTQDGTTRHFVGVLSSGFDSTVNERANAMRWPNGQARYIAAMLAELRRFSALGYRVLIDDHAIDDDGMLVSVGNGTSFGGGMRVCPQAQVDDGLLDLIWLRRVTTAQFLRVFPRVYRGTHTTHPAVRSYTGRRIEIQAHGQVAYADGERLGPVPVTIEVVPSALPVIDVAATS